MRRRSVVALAALVALIASTSAATHVVRSGDTLWRLAQQYGTTVQELVNLNEIANPDLIRVGQILRVRGDEGPGEDVAEAASRDDGTREDGASSGPPAQDEAGSKATTTYRIRPGDTLFSIARAHRTTVAELVRLNAIANPNLIRAGQQIRVTGDPAADSPPSSSQPGVPATGSWSQARVEALLSSVAREHGMDPALVKAVAWQESRWRVDAVSPAGARGLMQVMPMTGQWIGTALAGRKLDLRDPHDNVLAGVLYLRYLQHRTGGDEARMLASYLQGPNAVARRGISAAGQRYVANVQSHRARFR